MHVLVAHHFISPRPVGMLVLHGPAGKSCNHVKNLSYGTYTQNALDRIRDKTDIRGSDVPGALFDRIAIWHIWYDYVFLNMSENELSMKYNARSSIIRNIILHKTYKNC